jgi:hypothetical protein
MPTIDRYFIARWTFVATMLGGAALILTRPDLFLPAWFGCFHCADGSEAQVVYANVAYAAFASVALLIPAVLALALWRRLAGLREYGTIFVTSAQRAALTRKRVSLRVLSILTTLLALIAGGLVVQLGYMSG